MPTYDYECDACGHQFELFQSISADPEKKCPECKKLKLRRLIGTGAAVMFKGSGFYQTDYRSESYKKSASADSKTSGGGGTESSGGSSSKGGSSSDSKSTESKASDSKASESKPSGGKKAKGGGKE
jgi:putative FmdB family regulatory protein